MSAGSGLVLGALSFFIAGLIRDRSPNGSILNVAHWIGSFLPFPFASRLLLTLALSVLLAYAGNLLLHLWVRYVQRKNQKTNQVVNSWFTDRIGTPLAQLLRKAAVRQRLVLLSLQSRKVYCGRILEVPPNLDDSNSYIELLPKFSAYRDKDTLQLGEKRTEYPAISVWEANQYVAGRHAVLEELNKRLEKMSVTDSRRDVLVSLASGLRQEIDEAEAELAKFAIPSDFEIEDWVKIIPIAEIESATFYDPDAYEMWFNNKPEPTEADSESQINDPVAG